MRRSTTARALPADFDPIEAEHILERLTAIVTVHRRELARALIAEADARQAKARYRRGSWSRIGSAIGLATSTALTAHVASATFTGGTTGQVTQGTVQGGDLVLTGTSPDSGNSQSFNTNITDFYPNETIYRAVTLTIDNTAGKNVGYGVLQVQIASSGCSGCQTSLLDSDATNGLQLDIERCSVPWSYNTGSAPDRTYTCSGSQVTVKSAALSTFTASGNANSATDISNNSLLTAGAVNYYMFEYTLPNGTANTTQGLTSIINIKFQGTARGGLYK
jgi:hypothetical protein